MPLNLSIKSVPDSLAARLRARAAANHRSLQGELMAILEAAAGESGVPAARTDAVASLPSDWRTRLSLVQAPSRSTTQTVEQVAERIKASYGKAGARGESRGESSVALVRAMRDERYGEARLAGQEKARRPGRTRRGG